MNDTPTTLLLIKIYSNEYLTMPQEQLYELIEIAIKESVYQVTEALDIIDYPLTTKLEQLITIEKLRQQPPAEIPMWTAPKPYKLTVL
jgi:hypothetical protein